MTASTKKSILKMSRPALCVCALILMSCFKTPEYATLKVEVSPPGSGTVSRTTPPHDGKNSWEYETGTSVELQAKANGDYEFSHWSGADGGANTTTTVTVNNDMTVTANFVKTGGGETTVPDVPTGVTATADNRGGIRVSWSAVTDAVGYRIYRSTNSSNGFAEIDTLEMEYYYDYELSLNTTYYYKVSAYNGVGESSQSSYTYATTQQYFNEADDAFVKCDNGEEDCKGIAFRIDAVYMVIKEDGTWKQVNMGEWTVSGVNIITTICEESNSVVYRLSGNTLTLFYAKDGETEEDYKKQTAIFQSYSGFDICSRRCLWGW
jgi:hypothetical protein